MSSQIEAATHEAGGHLYYHSGELDDWDGLDPYWAIGSLLIGEFEGHKQTVVEIDGEEWAVDLAYTKSGIAPRPGDAAGERLYEFELHLDGEGRRKSHFNLSPRFEEMRHYESGDELTFPFHHLDADEGLSVHFQPSNVDIDEIPTLLHESLRGVFESADERFRDSYLRRPQGGRIEALERYVRITRDWSRKLTAEGEILDSLASLLSNSEGTKGELKWDNSELVGYIHQLRTGRVGAGQMAPGHQYGKQIKSYYPRDPQAHDEDDPLHHPKLGVLFKKKLHKSTIRWENRHDLLDELDETLLNVLHWADIPTEVGEASDGSNTVFVADDHFDVAARDQDVPLFEDPTPRLEAEQDHLLMTLFEDMTDSDSEIVKTVATDGGQDVDEVAESTGYSMSTIYRCLGRLDELLDNRDGHIRFMSEKIAQDIKAIIESAEYQIENAMDRAGQLLEVDVVQATSSAVSQFLSRYAAEYHPPDDDDGPGRIRFDTMLNDIKSTSHPYLPNVLEELVNAWHEDGRKHHDVNEIIIEADLTNGDHLQTTVGSLR